MADYTFDGLSKCYNELFEEYGWNVLNKDLMKGLQSGRSGKISPDSQRRLDKLVVYALRIQQCKSALHARKETDESKKLDISTMMRHLHILERRARMLLTEVAEISGPSSD